MYFPYADQFLIVEALYVNRISVRSVAKLIQHVEKWRRNIYPLVPVPRRALDLRVNANRSTIAGLQFDNELKFFRESMQSKYLAIRLIAVWINRSAVRVSPFMHRERFDFFKSEVPGVIPAVTSLPIGKHARDVGYAIQVNIVQHNEFIVTGGDDVLFEVIGPHCVRESLGRQRMFGQVARSPPVRDYNRSNRLARPRRIPENRRRPSAGYPYRALETG